MREELSGGCQCGRIRYRVGIKDRDAYLCHCRMCQHATGGVAAAFKNVARAEVRWDREPDRYASSPIAVRGFCTACGTPLTYEAHGNDHMDLTVGSFDDPYGFRPTDHACAESRHEAWLDTTGLPAERTEQNTGLVKRWMDAVGKLPD